jgi:hypothetical protein
MGFSHLCIATEVRRGKIVCPQLIGLTMTSLTRMNVRAMAMRNHGLAVSAQRVALILLKCIGSSVRVVRLGHLKIVRNNYALHPFKNATEKIKLYTYVGTGKIHSLLPPLHS